MTAPPEILISAGEASGDMYAAQLARALQARTSAHFFGMGGPKMREAGVEIVADASEIAVVGNYGSAAPAARCLARVA